MNGNHIGGAAAFVAALSPTLQGLFVLLPPQWQPVAQAALAIAGAYFLVKSPPAQEPPKGS